VTDTLLGDTDIEGLETGDSPEPEPVESDLRVRAKKFVFQALFEKAAAVVPTKDIMPVLKNFQVEVTTERLRVMATDLELSVIAYTELVAVERPGTAVFPAKRMLEIIREADDEEMTVDVSGGEASISVGRASWTLKLQGGDDYPALPEISEVVLHPINRVKFLGALGAVRYAAATEVNRPSLMMINVAGGKMTACDGVRFQQASVGEDFPLELQIPILAVDDLVKLLRTNDLEEIGIGETDFHLVFRVGHDVFVVNKLMVQFPDVEALLLRPALKNKDILRVDRAELVAAIRRVRITADPETSAVVLALDTDQVKVTAKDKFGNAGTETIGASWQSGARSVVVNHKFLTDMISMYDGRSCEFRLGPESKTRPSPILLIDTDTGTTGVIGQMRADWITS
jgi:DNA polymerase-3 subunit beta